MRTPQNPDVPRAPHFQRRPRSVAMAGTSSPPVRRIPGCSGCRVFAACGVVRGPPGSQENFARVGVAWRTPQGAASGGVVVYDEVLLTVQGDSATPVDRGTLASQS